MELPAIEETRAGNVQIKSNSWEGTKAEEGQGCPAQHNVDNILIAHICLVGRFLLN